jgi:predicted PurR-regulated permease PerM
MSEPNAPAPPPAEPSAGAGAFSSEGLDPLPVARRRHTIFLAVCAAIVAAVIIASHSVLLPFVLALVIAYVLAPAVAWVERKRVPRAIAIILVYVVVLGSFGLFIRLLTPRVAHEIGNFRRELPTISKTIKNEWVPLVQQRIRALGLGGEVPAAVEKPEREGPGQEETPAIVARQRSDGSFAIELEGPLAINPTKHGGYTVEPMREPKAEPFNLDKLVADLAGKSMAYAQHNALEIVKFGRDVIAGVMRFFFVFGITLMLAAYTILTRERILGFFESLVRPRSRPSWNAFLARVDQGLSGVVRGQLLICLVNGVLSAIGFAIVGLKYWPVLALIATVFSLIPIFGSIISAIPAVILGLTQSFGTAVFVLVWIIGIHQLEANLLNPKIMGDAAKIHPVLVIFSLLVGEHFFGVVGALLAVPVMSIAQSIFIHVRRELQSADPEMTNEPVGTIPPSPPA